MPNYLAVETKIIRVAAPYDRFPKRNAEIVCLAAPYPEVQNRRQKAALARATKNLLAVLVKQDRVGVSNQDYLALAPATRGPGTEL